jgi:hypothetical protein
MPGKKQTCTDPLNDGASLGGLASARPADRKERRKEERKERKRN